MNEQHKYLTEAMGYRYIKTITGGHFGFCVQYEDENGRDFIVMAGVFFFLIWEWVQDKEWFEEFLNIMDVGEYIHIGEKDFTFDLQKEFVNPDRFANAVYEFLKGRDQ